MAEPKSRHGCLTAWLILMLVANSGNALMYAFNTDALRKTLPDAPDWYFPVRQALAAVLLDAGRAAEAEAVYWQDLKKSPGNGWSLFGLARALEVQGKDDAAKLARRRFEDAWGAADVELTASRF